MLGCSVNSPQSSESDANTQSRENQEGQCPLRPVHAGAAQTSRSGQTMCGDAGSHIVELLFELEHEHSEVNLEELQGRSSRPWSHSCSPERQGDNQVMLGTARDNFGPCSQGNGEMNLGG